MTADLAPVLFVLAIASSALWLALVLSTAVSVAGTGRSAQINLVWLLVGAAFWVAWVVFR